MSEPTLNIEDADRLVDRCARAVHSLDEGQQLREYVAALRAERDAAREEAQRWVQIARAALAAAQTQEPTDPVKT